eukprot:Clim_evm9s64 gene=Clim_evmTU9s64
METGVMYDWRVKSIKQALADRGLAEGPLTVKDLTNLGHLDQYHYNGVHANEEIIELLGLTAGRKVLDIGAGIGGPARYLSYTSGCEVVAVEPQESLCTAAMELTERVEGLSEKVKFVNGTLMSATDAELGLKAGDAEEIFDHFISLLVFLHVADRSDNLKKAFKYMKQGGTFVIEDFVSKGLLDANLLVKGKEDKTDYRAMLENVVHAYTVTTIKEYMQELTETGFVDLAFEDMAEDWISWTGARHKQFIARADENKKSYGEVVFKERSDFYQAISDLFGNGAIGGARITGRKPTLTEVSLRAGRRAFRTNRLLGKDTAATNGVNVVEGGDIRIKSEVMTGKGPNTDGKVLAMPFPAPEVEHDSLQFHFFLPGTGVLAFRLFYTKSMNHASCWLWTGTETDAQLHLFQEESKPFTTQQRKDTNQFEVIGDHYTLVDGALGGSLELRGAFISENPAFQELDLKTSTGTVQFTWSSGKTFAWAVPGNTSGVGHRPMLNYHITAGDGTGEASQITHYGYSKRYYGTYGPHWGYRFITSIFFDQTTQKPIAAVWNADATFNDKKYNYFHILHADGRHDKSLTEDAYQQQTTGFCTMGGNGITIDIEPQANWIVDIKNDTMNSRMRQSPCISTVNIDGVVWLTNGRAINETCYGAVI